MKIKVGSTINVACEEGDFPAKIQSIDSESKMVSVEFLDPATLKPSGETIDDVPFSSLRRFDAPGPAVVESRADVGFNQYFVTWTGANFKFRTEDPACEFYGQWRRTVFRPSNTIGFGIDMWAHFSGRDFCVETVLYTEDPRLDMRSLEGDLCAMANRFLYGRLSGTLDTLDDLIKRASKPTVKITRLQTIDAMILGLKELRETAISCGGQRYFVVPTDVQAGPDVPEVILDINLTTEAILYKDQRPPTIDYSKSYVNFETGERTTIKADKGLIRDLVTRLNNCKDPAEARRIRGQLRKMGHRGGTRFMPEGD